jgi:hypothetical protein
MLNTLFRSLCIIAGISFPLTAQKAVLPDSAVSTVIQDTAVIPQESSNTDPQPLYRPASTIPPKPVDTVVASDTVLSATPAASGRIMNSSDYISGKMDGERDAYAKGIWFLAGLPGICCYGIGVGGVLCSFLVPPSPPQASLIGKSGEYIMGYTEGFQSKGRLKNAKYASLGCLAGTAIETALYVIFVLLMEQSY